MRLCVRRLNETDSKIEIFTSALRLCDRFFEVATSLNSRRVSRWCNALKERMSRPDYLAAAQTFRACPQEVVIVGMGPMGLRLGVELALMGNGTHVTILEKRGMGTCFDRHNILHLWSWMETDIHALGASHQATGGSYMHIGTRDFQSVLLRVLLAFGVTLQFNSTARKTLVMHVFITRNIRVWGAV